LALHGDGLDLDVVLLSQRFCDELLDRSARVTNGMRIIHLVSEHWVHPPGMHHAHLRLTKPRLVERRPAKRLSGVL
jgi:hypothetical protein